MKLIAPPEKLGSFYLGGKYNLKINQISKNPVNYDARDLTTHAVCVGMTGSGKTGLCIGLLEEAALDKVPAIIIDPKGDITNLMLQFPKLRPEDFKPWINPDDARRKGKTVDEYSKITADLWRNGLSGWGIDPSRILALKEAADFAIFTPGSDSGIPISLMSSLEAPNLDFEENSEVIREQITGTVAALLELVSVKVDPVRSREAILLATIFEQFWRRNKDLDLTKLITSIQKPPVRKLGIFDVDTFYPEKDRFQLAMAFNSLVASPNFQSWLQGEPLDIDKLLYTKQGKPRHCIFYLAHLSERERMLIVTLLLEKVLIWTRRQTGTTSLRALLYFDEVFGFMPPVAEPPSKRPLITLLKQARAFGLGCVLVTQNPVDIDYKALTNTGTWFIGKLQTERDKNRVLAGLKGATLQAGGEDTKNYSEIISSLKSRVFLYHNVHENQPIVFNTRWVMSYLRGPLTRPQVGVLMTNKKERFNEENVESYKYIADKTREEDRIRNLSENLPTLPPSISQVFVPINISKIKVQQILNQKTGSEITIEKIHLAYKPTIFGNAIIRFLNRKYKIDQQIEKNIISQPLEEASFLDWKSAKETTTRSDDLLSNQESISNVKTYFDSVPAFANSSKEFKNLSKDLQDFLYYETSLKLRENLELDIIQNPQESERDFQIRLLQVSREQRDDEVDKLKKKYEKKLDKLEDKLEKLEFDLASDKSEYEARKREEFLGAGESVLGFFLGSRRTTTASKAARKRRLTSKAKRKIEKSKEGINKTKKDTAELESKLEKAVNKIVEKYEKAAERISWEEIKPKKTDIKVKMIALAWQPFWVINYKEKGLSQITYLNAHKQI
jgi:hypothetical protein